ncbi:glycosyltransferase, family 2 [Waddlia chondrophila 2032/99]|uniref:Glycosyltransferase, family 2 n=1 Tax=Waddlia chondrophila 2032/99 TaxID=765953 RepID=F8LEM9_9BACT|nr:glycosyltransferase, family 2 [Waddlia chondrophila 2032/99]
MLFKLKKKQPERQRVSVIIISYNNESQVAKCLDALRQQTVSPHQMILVDTGSKDRSYLEKYREECYVIEAEPHCGFCVGNNLGYLAVDPEADAVLFLNPDAFLFPDFLENGARYLSHHTDVGAITGLTLGYDFEMKKPTGFVDTTGIFSTWYGKWYDRGQGSIYDPVNSPGHGDIPAICGAVFLGRKKALDQTRINREVMDSRYFMYKEDIDLSLRLLKKKWKLRYVPELKAYHCRGWKKNRKEMPRQYRLYSARNELRVNWGRKHLIGSLYSLTKYLTVKVFNC